MGLSHSNARENISNTCPEGCNAGVDVQLPAVFEEDTLDLLASEAWHAAPDGAEGDTCEGAAPTDRQRQHADQRRNAVAPQLSLAEHQCAQGPYFFKRVYFFVWLAENLVKLDLNMLVDTLWIPVAVAGAGALDGGVRLFWGCRSHF